MGSNPLALERLISAGVKSPSGPTSQRTFAGARPWEARNWASTALSDLAPGLQARDQLEVVPLRRLHERRGGRHRPDLRAARDCRTASRPRAPRSAICRSSCPSGRRRGASGCARSRAGRSRTRRSRSPSCTMESMAPPSGSAWPSVIRQGRGLAFCANRTLRRAPLLSASAELADPFRSPAVERDHRVAGLRPVHRDKVMGFRLGERDLRRVGHGRQAVRAKVGHPLNQEIGAKARVNGGSRPTGDLPRGLPCGRIRLRSSPGWRNWQTQQTQNLPPKGVWVRSPPWAPFH